MNDELKDDELKDDELKDDELYVVIKRSAYDYIADEVPHFRNQRCKVG